MKKVHVSSYEARNEGTLHVQTGGPNAQLTISLQVLKTLLLKDFCATFRYVHMIE